MFEIMKEGDLKANLSPSVVDVTHSSLLEFRTCHLRSAKSMRRFWNRNYPKLEVEGVVKLLLQARFDVVSSEGRACLAAGSGAGTLSTWEVKAKRQRKSTRYAKHCSISGCLHTACGGSFRSFEVVRGGGCDELEMESPVAGQQQLPA